MAYWPVVVLFISGFNVAGSDSYLTITQSPGTGWLASDVALPPVLSGRLHARGTEKEIRRRSNIRRDIDGQTSSATDRAKSRSPGTTQTTDRSEKTPQLNAAHSTLTDESVEAGLL